MTAQVPEQLPLSITSELPSATALDVFLVNDHLQHTQFLAACGRPLDLGFTTKAIAFREGPYWCYVREGQCPLYFLAEVDAERRLA
eukprot:m.27328 g.27328  ORF g.27328 m.27328 type:complete len:86 (-) comp4748_c0_seq1:2614-2871(-)